MDRGWRARPSRPRLARRRSRCQARKRPATGRSARPSDPRRSLACRRALSRALALPCRRRRQSRARCGGDIVAGEVDGPARLPFGLALDEASHDPAAQARPLVGPRALAEVPAEQRPVEALGLLDVGYRQFEPAWLSRPMACRLFGHGVLLCVVTAGFRTASMQLASSATVGDSNMVSNESSIR